MPGSGKSTLWKQLAKNLGFHFLDFDDDVLEVTQSKSVWELVCELSETNFMQLEEDECLKLNFKSTVFSTSWSLPYSKRSITHLKALWTIIYLQVDINEIKNRISKMKTERIIGFMNKNLDVLLKEREKLYIDSSDIIFEYSGNDINSISNCLLKKIWLTSQK